MRSGMFTAWAYGLSAYVWWCGFDQDRLGFPPYTRKAIERELGLLTAGSDPKPVAREMKAFRAFLREVPFARLPRRRVDAICLVSEQEDGWAASLGAFLLARQAGLDLAFAGAERKDYPESKLYILPSGTGCDPYTAEAWNRVLAKADAGSTVLITKGNRTRYSGLRQATGNRIETFTLQPTAFAFSFADGLKIRGGDETTTRIAAVESEVLAKTDAGAPVMTVKRYGKGKVLFVNFPLEIFAARSSDCFTGEGLNPLYAVYRETARQAGIGRRVTCENPSVGLTEHVLESGKVVVVAVNYEPKAVKAALGVNGKVGRVWRGRLLGSDAEIGANDAAVFEIE